MKNQTLRFGSVCSGIEAASVAWHPLGWKAAWLSEIEPFPSAVLAHHYPDVPNLGDMTAIPEKIRRRDIEAPDIFCGGTPCQAFSVAGKRQSLDDERGNLSLTFCEIANAIDDIRHTDGQQPAIIFWENVPGVLSTKDNAFGCFLGELAGEDCAIEPPRGKWSNAGCVFGPQRTIAWRILDAQFFGVAQRRRRVFVVASARDGFDPTAVLFEFDGMRRDTPPRREAGQSTAHDVAPSLTASGRGVERIGETRGQDPAVLQPVAFQSSQSGVRLSDTHATLDANNGPRRHNGVIAFDTTQVTSKANRSNPKPGDPCHPLAAGAHPPLIAFDSRQDPVSSEHIFGALGSSSPQAQAVCVTGEITHTLRGEGFDASEDGTGRGNPIVAQAVSLRGRDGGATAELGGDVSNCLRASSGGGDKPHVLAPIAHRDVMPTMVSGGSTDASHNQMSGQFREEYIVPQGMAVRRLTPVECERLQGFPDDYTMIPWKAHQAWAKKKGKFADGKSFEEWLIETTGQGLRQPTTQDCPDGPRYKALGNSWAVPNVRWIGERIDNALRGNT